LARKYFLVQTEKGLHLLHLISANAWVGAVSVATFKVSKNIYKYACIGAR
jgi:putative copper export protein